MKKFFSMFSLAAVMLVAMFAATPQVAQAFNADVIVDSIQCNAGSNTISVRLKFVNNEDRAIKFWGVDPKMLDIYNPNGNMVFSSGSFTVNVDPGGNPLVIPGHSAKTWDFTLNKSIAPNMDNVPNITYDWNAGWRLRWDYFPRCDYAD